MANTIPAEQNAATGARSTGTWEAYRAWLRRRDPVTRLLVLFFITLVILSAVFFFPAPQRVLDSYLAGIARLSCGLLTSLGVEARLTDTTIWTPHYAVTVARSCAALELMLVFTSAVIAFPVSWKRKVAGLLLGILMIPAANLLRVASLFVVGRFYSGKMDVVHREVWPVALIVITFALWLAWFEWAKRGKDFDLHAA